MEFHTIIDIKRRHDAGRLEAACVRACAAGTISYRSVKSILDTKLDAVPLESSAITTRLPATHAHVRGAAYYDPATDTSPLTLLLTDAVC